MKTRKDQLIECAFGELSAAEKQGLNLSAAEREEMNAFASLRADLRALREVPDCQISTERMRDAVLKSEIRQRQDWRRWLPLAAVPVAAALALVALNLAKAPDAPSRSNFAASEKPVSSPLVVRRTEDTMPSTFDASDVAAFMLNATAFIDSLATDTEKATATTRTKRAKPRINVRLASTRNQPVVRLATKKETAPVPATPVRSIPAPTNQPEPIVMISNEQDNNTGARRANEVETSHDVVIGG